MDERTLIPLLLNVANKNDEVGRLLFSILTPAIGSLSGEIAIEPPGPLDKAPLGGRASIARGLANRPAAAGQEMLGIDHAILVPAIASMVTTINGEQPGAVDKGLAGFAFRIARELAPVIGSVVRGAMKDHQPG
ncbi:hypothetical protein AYJ54_17760 [Bradyrhizobium centrolobii]|uniref:Uncharacterized protein n=2 Tax=Bradyrhizobium TaxID=374 RepID=A0A176ZGW7_9BRAD|nr:MULTISPECIES: hypothetical protein [Bradyrhizobium]OAF07409.1 hypothetical protein AYJ54_17760 [Bradyrhizobium centrolobii]OAF19727.1 hypothetical protein AXW67_35835 [Bradyrhizobium neotropicale]